MAAWGASGSSRLLLVASFSFALASLVVLIPPPLKSLSLLLETQPSHSHTVPIKTAIMAAETGAARAVAGASKQAVEAALMQAALSVPGQRKREAAAAKAAAMAERKKPSAAWLAGERALAARNPLSAMVSLAGENQEAVKGTRRLGAPVLASDVQASWAHGYPNPSRFFHKQDRYVHVGEAISPTEPHGNEEGGEVNSEEHAPTSEPAAQGAEGGPHEEGADEGQAEPGEKEGQEQEATASEPPLWKDPMPLHVLCHGRNASWCSHSEAQAARASSLPSLASRYSGANKPGAPVLSGGVRVPGGRVVWVPLQALQTRPPAASAAAAQARVGDVIARGVGHEGLVGQKHAGQASQHHKQLARQRASGLARAASSAPPSWDPKKFYKEVIYRRNGQPAYALYSAPKAGRSAQDQPERRMTRQEELKVRGGEESTGILTNDTEGSRWS